MLPLLRQSLLILDGAFFAHRSFHSTLDAPLAVFIDQVLRTIAREQREFVVCAWDAPGPNYRHELFADYKSNRPEKDPALVDHICACRDALEAMGVAVYDAPGFEGDDVVATLARRWTREGGDVRIHTADKDILQLVDEQTCVVIQGKPYVHENVVEKYGIGPELIPAWLALAGDSSDGIPGIPGIGGQTASRLLATFGSMEAVLEGAPSSGDPRARRLVGREEDARLYERLTVLHEGAPVEADAVDMVCHVHPEILMPARFADVATRYSYALEPYRERALTFDERFAIMRMNGSPEDEARRSARSAAGRVLVER